ncbi:MAG TPA: DNA primase [Candidatus Portnoybacteria bacterium]|nr:DNA primase [Candidatus Portnoybacteria bacterium]HOZ16326.1 DNA primase [Candidatus Portnoybacteria bacterium]HPH52398.1 DNA primase [Candidatus Portnoybacteria bacterium]HPM28674.1 DNA primase [Candidatus Portnoybacteria bacterium]
MSPIDEIKSRLDVVEVIEGYIKLKKAGKDYKAPCPFHKEKNPSFFVSPSKQIWHCFSCNIGGDIFSFVQKIEGIEFPEALRILAKKAGVVLKREDPQIRSQRNILFEICDEAVEYFQKQLEANKPALEYIKNRGLKPETIKEFKIGYSNNLWDGLLCHLTEIGYKVQDIEKAGLIIKKENENRYFDRFRSRIMFPLCDLNGQVVGFTGRIFESAPTQLGRGSDYYVGGKYVNTPETLIYNKSHIIYGLDKAKTEIRKQNQCVAVEGQMDLIMCHQAGCKNAVAVSGTALTADHLQTLKRYTENLLFSFDADTGGEGATKRAIGLAQQYEFNVKIAILPEAEKDPAEIIKQSPEKWGKILENSKPIVDFYFENAFNKYKKENLSIDDKREITKELLVPIKNIVNVVEQAHWLQVLASKLKIEEKILIEALRRIKDREEGKEMPSEHFAERSRIKELEEILLGLVLKYPEHLEYLNKNFYESLLNTEELKKFVKSVKTNKIESKEDKFLADYLIFKVEHLNIEEAEVLKEMDFCIQELKKNHLKEKLIQISLDIKELENQPKDGLPAKEKDKEKLQKLNEKFCKLAEELSEITNN